MILIAVVVIVIVVVGGIAAYYVMNSGNNNGNGGNGNGDTVNIEDASSLQFDADVTSQGFTITYKLAGKNLGMANLKIRIDLLGGDAGNYIYILDAGEQKAWANADDTWTDVSSDFTAQWESWGTEWTNYVDNLANWTGTGDWSYTAPNGDSIRIYNISIDPVLPDSLFQPT